MFEIKNYYKQDNIERIRNAKSINEIFVTLIDMRKHDTDIKLLVQRILNYIKNGSLRNELNILPFLRKVKIEERYNIRFLSESEQIKMITKKSIFMVYIENPSEYIKLQILNTYNIGFIDFSDITKFSEEEMIQILSKDPVLIKYCKNVTDQLIGKVIRKNPYIIKYIENPSDMIKKIINEVVGKENLPQNGFYIQYIKSPSSEMQLIAVKQNGCSIQYINNPSVEIQMEAVKNDSMAIKYIKNPTIEVLIESVKKDPFSIQYLNEIPFKVQLYAVKIDGNSIKYIKNCSLKVAMEAVRNSETAISYIKEPPLAVQLESIRSNPNSIKYIKNPHKEALKLYDNIKSIEEKSKLYNKNVNLVKQKQNYFKPDYEDIFKNIDSKFFYTYIINWKDDLSNHINYLCKKINAIEFKIATGFVMKSGLELISGSINHVLNNNGSVNLIIGSLQKYNEILHNGTGKVIGMDSVTAEFINDLIDKGVIVKTFTEHFYHGKFYMLKGDILSCIIIGSSNLSASGFNGNRELNILYIFLLLASSFGEILANNFTEFFPFLLEQ